MKRARPFRQIRRCESGATAIEFAIISVVMILVCLGIIEFGRGLHMRSELAFAADYGARRVLTEPMVSDADLQSLVRSAFVSKSIKEDPELAIVIGTEAVGAVQFRTISLSYRFTPIISAFGDAVQLNLQRRVPVG